MPILHTLEKKAQKKASLWKNEGLTNDAKKRAFFLNVCLIHNTLEKDDTY